MDFTTIELTNDEKRFLEARREHHEAIARAFMLCCAEPEKKTGRRARVYAYLIKRARRARALADVVYQASLTDQRR